MSARLASASTDAASFARSVYSARETIVAAISSTRAASAGSACGRILRSCHVLRQGCEPLRRLLVAGAAAGELLERAAQLLDRDPVVAGGGHGGQALDLRAQLADAPRELVQSLAQLDVCCGSCRGGLDRGSQLAGDRVVERGLRLDACHDLVEPAGKRGVGRRPLGQLLQPLLELGVDRRPDGELRDEILQRFELSRELRAWLRARGELLDGGVQRAERCECRVERRGDAVEACPEPFVRERAGGELVHGGPQLRKVSARRCRLDDGSDHAEPLRQLARARLQRRERLLDALRESLDLVCRRAEGPLDVGHPAQCGFELPGQRGQPRLERVHVGLRRAALHFREQRLRRAHAARQVGDRVVEPAQVRGVVTGGEVRTAPPSRRPLRPGAAGTAAAAA